VHEAAPGRPNVVARLGGDPGPTVCYCSHIDVVPAGDHALWASDPFDGAIAEGRMHGRGTADAKGPVAAALEAVEILRAAGAPLQGTLELALVSDEETMGFKGAGYLVSEGIIAPDLAIVGEPTSLRVVRAQRGACWLRVSTTGTAGHGSAPERGEETLPEISHEVLGGPSISVGTISGGAKVNIVPASCVIEVDRRSIPPETKEDVLQSVRAAVELAKERFPDLEADVEVLFFADSFEVPEDSPVVTGVAASVADVTGAPAELIGFRGASDARFLFESGADVVVCGPGDIGVAHTAHESIDLAELERCALAYALSFARLLAPAGAT
jgi:acetylornithine deacetylase/succinyl-diaminopimelate desuccinylase-like protein